MRTTVALALVLAAGCSDASSESVDPGPPPTGRLCEAEAPPESLAWKRVDAFIADLQRGLELDGAEFCQELGRQDFPCATVHRVPLGGNDPIFLAQYEPVRSPLSTTAVAVERVALIACQNAVARDATTRRVFADLPPSERVLGEGDVEAVREQTSALYRRLLGRDPTGDELGVIASLGADDTGAPRSVRDFDTLSCLAIATTTENLLY
ncbi:MAG: hypothetical protein AAGF12_01470 [Myxococcota bacterium]